MSGIAWWVSQYCFVHPVHGSFFITVHAAGNAFVNRVYRGPDDLEVERFKPCSSIDDGKAAVACRIAELDEELEGDTL